MGNSKSKASGKQRASLPVPPQRSARTSLQNMETQSPSRKPSPAVSVAVAVDAGVSSESASGGSQPSPRCEEPAAPAQPALLHASASTYRRHHRLSASQTFPDGGALHSQLPTDEAGGSARRPSGAVGRAASCRRTRSVRAAPCKSPSFRGGGGHGGGGGGNGGGVLQLSGAEMVLVKRSWQHARNHGALEPAQGLFRTIAFKSPDARQLLGSTAASTAAEKLKVHASSLTQLMDAFIKNLEQNETLVPQLIEIGRRHANIPDFKVAFLNMFASTMIEKTLEWGEKTQRNETSQTAWTKIVLFLVEKVKDGYYEESKRQRREKYWGCLRPPAADDDAASPHRRISAIVKPLIREEITLTVTDDLGVSVDEPLR